MSYTDSDNTLDPGDINRESDQGFEHLELENIGSEPLDEIFAEITQHAEDPFGTSEDLNHNTGNFVTLTAETAQDGYEIPGLTSTETPHYVNRVEYEEENPPTYLELEEEGGSIGDITDIDSVEVARYRVGDVEYFIVIYSSGDLSTIEARIGQSPHTPTELGTTDFTEDSDDVVEYEVSDNEVEGTTNVYGIDGQDLVSFNTSIYDGEPVLNDNGGTDLPESIEDDEDTEERTYSHLLDMTDGDELQRVVRSRWDVTPSSPEDSDWDADDQTGTGAAFFVDAGDEDDALQPGQNFPLDIGVQTPLGVDNDQIEEGTVSIIASEFE